MAEYVEITCHFRNAHEQPTPGDLRRTLRLLRPRQGRRWQELLQEVSGKGAVTPVVLVAPSASGKTTELERQARRLRCACTLMRHPHLSLPSVPAIKGAIASRALFTEWLFSALAKIVECPVFLYRGTAAEAVQLG